MTASAMVLRRQKSAETGTDASRHQPTHFCSSSSRYAPVNAPRYEMYLSHARRMHAMRGAQGALAVALQYIA